MAPVESNASTDSESQVNYKVSARIQRSSLLANNPARIV